MLNRLMWIERVFIPNIGVVLFMISCGWMFIEAVSRRFFNHSFIESEEIVCFSLAWAVFLTLAQSGREGHHIRITLVIRLLPPLCQRVFLFIKALSGVVYTLIIAASAAMFILHLREGGVVSYSPMRIPLWMVNSAVLIGGLLLILYYLEDLVKVLSGKNKNKSYSEK